MRKVLFVCIILISYLLSHAQQSITVYKDSTPIAILYSNTNIENDKDCYILDTLNIWNKNIIIKTDAILFGSKNEDSKQWFSRLFSVKFEQHNKDIILKFENLITSDCHWLYIKKGRKNKLSVFKEVSFGESTVNIENSNNEIIAHDSKFICTENVSKPIVDIITPANYFSFNDKNSKKECFDCPTNYSIEECLIIKKKKQKLKWE